MTQNKEYEEDAKNGPSKRTKFSYDEIKKFGNTPPLNDRGRLVEHIENISNKNSVISSVAATYTGYIAEEHGAELVIICGALPELRKALLSGNVNLVRCAATAVGQIAYSGGANELAEAGFPEILFHIIKSPHHRRMEKNAAAKAIGYIISHVSQKI